MGLPGGRRRPATCPTELQCTPRARLRGTPPPRTRLRLRRERRAAAAGAFGVRVVELETRSVEPLDVVDLGVLEVLEAHRIDVELHPVRLELLVHVADLVLEVEIVGEASAASAAHPHAGTDRKSGAGG